MPTVSTDQIPGGWNLPVGCQISGASPNVQVTFFTPSPTAAQLASGIGSTAASPWGAASVAVTPATLANLNAALSAYSPFAGVQAVATYAFWAAYALFQKAGGS